MNTLSIILSGLLMMALVVMMAPSIVAMSHGKTLRNIALWLAIFLALGLVYQNFGPGSTQPLFGFPGIVPQGRPQDNGDSTIKAGDEKSDDSVTAKGDQGFSPPRE